MDKSIFGRVDSTWKIGLTPNNLSKKGKKERTVGNGNTSKTL